MRTTMEWKKGITKETREKREGNYSDLERPVDDKK
jgi:hypothetical protein